MQPGRYTSALKTLAEIFQEEIKNGYNIQRRTTNVKYPNKAREREENTKGAFESNNEQHPRNDPREDRTCVFRG